MRRFRDWLISVLAVFALAASMTPAWAAPGGEIDETNQYPFAGALVRNATPPRVGCSGTLIHPRVFLTAGHCTAVRPWQYRVSFGVDSLDPSTWLRLEAAIQHPEFDWTRHSSSEAAIAGGMDPYDVGVIILREPVADIEPAWLPTEGFLDKLKEFHVIPGEEATVAGYGATAVEPSDDFRHVHEGYRRVVTPEFQILRRYYVALHAFDHGDPDGVCFGDSGAAALWANSDGHPIVVATVSMGNLTCKGNGFYYRTDIPQVLDFLDSVIERVEVGEFD
jgi:hypothetical protein